MPDDNQNPGGEQQNQNPGGGGGQQQTGKEYLQFFPEPLRGEKTLEKFSGKDINEVLGKVATSYVNLEKHAGGAIKVPGENASPEEWNAFYAKLGRPEKADGYGIELKVPEGLPWNKEAEKVFLTKFHEYGLTKRQAEGILNDYLQMVSKDFVDAAQGRSASRDDAYKTLEKDHWGGLTAQKVALVQRGVHEFGADIGFKDWLDETGAGNDPRFFLFMERAFRPLLEDGLIKGENLGMSRADAQAEITKIRGSEEWQGKKGREAQRAAVDRIRELSQLAHGEE